jgi:hypothetical protein
LIDYSNAFAFVETEDLKQPMHRMCYGEIFVIKCAVCNRSIPSRPDGKVSFVKHPFFDTEQMCPRHAGSNRKMKHLQTEMTSDDVFVWHPSFVAYDAEAGGFKFFQVPDANKATPDTSVTAILCLSGLPRDLADPCLDQAPMKYGTGYRRAATRIHILVLKHR